MKSIAALGALLICAAAPASELHPIIEVQSAYLFGATADGRWMKAEAAANALPDERTYQIYGLRSNHDLSVRAKEKGLRLYSRSVAERDSQISLASR